MSTESRLEAVEAALQATQEELEAMKELIGVMLSEGIEIVHTVEHIPEHKH